MMKKVLYGVAIALLAGASVGTLQSCKDDVSDLKTQTSFDLEQLRNDLAGVKKGLEDKLADTNLRIDQLIALLDQYAKVTYVDGLVNQLKTDINNQITGINGEISTIKGDLVNIKGDITTLQGNVSTLTQEDARLLSMIQTNLNDINDLKGKYNTLHGDLQDLSGKYDALNTDLGALKGVVDGIKGQVSADSLALDQLRTKVLANEASIATINSTLTQLQTGLSGLETKVADMDSVYTGKIDLINGELNTINGKFNTLDLRLAGIDTTLNTIDGRLNGIDGILEALGGRVDTVEGDVSALNTAVGSLQTAVNSINSALNGMAIKISDLEGRVGNLEGNMLALNNNVSELIQKVYNIRRELDTLISDFSELSGNVATLTTRVDTLESKLSDLSTRLDNMVNSLLIQATDSPVFGNFSLPLGVKSTLLFNWYGENTKGIRKFPSFSDTYEYRTEEQGAEVLQRFEGMGDVQVDIMDGIIGDVDLGSVYLTLNPVGHYFDDKNFVIETSKGTPLPVSIDVKKSDEELTFGYSRDRAKIEGNGFYAANIKITGDEEERARGVVAARVEIDQNLKSAVKDVFKERSGRSAVALLKAVYGQLDGMLPAYAIRYNWAEGPNNYSVLSNYDLAIATARPLSYNFYRDGSINYRLHKYGHINNVLEQLRGKFEIKFTPISFDNITITLPPMNLTGVDVSVEPMKPIEIMVRGVNVNIDGVDYPVDEFPVVVDVKDINNLVSSLSTQITTQVNNMMTEIKGWTANANEQISNQLKSQLQPIADQINGMVDDLQGQIDSILNDVINTAEPWFQRLNRVVDLYNRVADKVNNFLEDPNHYLQVAMFYNQKNNGVGMVSNMVESPTPFASGNGVITLYASSYSGEIVAPAFKKYVACTRVFDANGNVIDAAKESTLRSKVNDKASFFNKVMDGYTIRYDVPTSAIEKNYIYEISYQGLDYSGITSTQKFYITVK